jgi:hypothetical protein
MEQIYRYYKRVDCRENANVMAIIVVISKKGKIKEYTEFDITYHPRIIKTKTINKEKDLKRIRDKFENNKVLSSEECSLLVAFPLFELNVLESEIVDEMCHNIKFKRNCIPDEELDGIAIGMYLNILEYIDLEEQDKLKEMINVDGRTEGVIGKFKREERIKAERNIIRELLKSYTVDEVSCMIHRKPSEIRNIISG